MTSTDARILITVHARVHWILHLILYLLWAVLPTSVSNLVHIPRIDWCEHALLELYTSTNVTVLVVIMVVTDDSGWASCINKSIRRRLYRVKLHIRRSHSGLIDLGKLAWVELWHSTARALASVLGLGWAWAVPTLVRVITSSIIQVALQLLISGLCVDVGDSCDFDTLTLRVLLIGILERILVKVNRRGSKTLRRRLLMIGTYLVWQAFEARSNFLSRKQLVHCPSVVSRS